MDCLLLGILYGHMFGAESLVVVLLVCLRLVLFLCYVFIVYMFLYAAHCAYLTKK